MNNRQIKVGAVLSYFAIAFNVISGLLYTPWMVAAIGKSQYGLYTLAQSVITLFLVDFGLSAATGRYLSRYNAEGDREGAERFLGAVYKLYLLIDAVILMILLAVFFLMDRIFVNLTAAELEQFRVVYAISAVFSVVNFPFVTFNGILTAYEKFIPLKVADLLYRIGNIGFTVIALLLGYGLYALVTVHAAVGLLVLLFKFIILRKTVALKVDFTHTDKGIYREIFGFSVWTTVSSLASRLVYNITPSILGIVASSAAIAVFGVVTTIQGYAFTITTAINGMFMPRISRIMTGADAEDALNRLFISVGKFQFALNGLIVTGFAVAGSHFIQLWMGEEYTQAYAGILLVLLPGLFYNALQIANTTMIVENKVKITAIIHVVTGVINVALSFPLSRIFGVTGACLSICTAHCVRDVICHIVYYRELPLDIPRFMKECYLKRSVPSLVTIACGAVMNRCVPDAGWGIFLLKAAVTVIIYMTVTLCFALNKQERKKILSWMRNNR